MFLLACPSFHLPDAHLDALFIFEQGDNHCRIRLALVVGIQNFRVKHSGRVSNHLRRHGVGKVHRQKGNVDVLKLFHLRYIFGIPGNIEPLVAEVTT